MEKLIVSCLIVLLVSFFALNAKAQKDSIYIKNASEFLKESFDRSIDTAFCEKYIRMAQKKVADGELYVPVSKKMFTKTALKVLFFEYSFKERDFILSDVVPKEIVCFDEVMLNAIKKKYSSTFLDSIQNLSDSLDKIGSGYKEAIYKGDKKLEDAFLSREILRDSITLNNDLAYVIVLTINKLGNIENKKYYYGRIDNLLPITNPRLQQELDQFTECISQWKPAELKGEPIDKEEVLIFDNSIIFKKE